MYDFANILFAGPCNRACPFCIGKEVDPSANVTNLDVFPLRNWETFVSEVKRLNIRELVFTGTTTDPHLYRHERRLIDTIRRELPEARISIHTNGALSLKKIETFNAYDRACISLPSLNPATYAKMMGSARVPDLARLLEASRIPVKVSCVVNEHNISEVDEYLRALASLGVRRAVLRRLYGDRREWNLLQKKTPAQCYRGNPVYLIDGMEVTVWNFDASESRSINLFANGTIGSSYLLAKTPEFQKTG